MLAFTKTVVGKIVLLLLITLCSDALIAQSNVKASLHYTDGIAFVNERNDKRAIRSFLKAVSADPEHDAARLMLTKLYLKLNQDDEAMDMINQLKKLKPTSQERAFEINYFIAYQKIKQELYNTADEALKKLVVEIHKTKAFDFQLLSRCYNALGYNMVVDYLNSETTNLVPKRLLDRANFYFRESLKYSPYSIAASINYNTINTALEKEPNSIKPYKISDFSLESPSPIPVSTSYKFPIDTRMVPKKSQKIIKTLGKYEELLLMIDGSGSMRTPIGLTDDVSRFQVMKNLVCQFFNELPSSLPIGMISVSGQCENPPKLVYSCETERADLFKALTDFRADGQTPVNNALIEAEKLFRGAGSQKAILFITDGMDSCSPSTTCELAAELGLKGIAIHIISFLDKKAASFEYESYTCISSATDGAVQVITTNGTMEEETFHFIIQDKLVLPQLREKKEKVKTDVAYFEVDPTRFVLGY